MFPSRARARTALVIGLLLATLAASPAIGQAQHGRTGGDQLRRRLIDVTAGRARIVDHDATGRVRFVGTDPGRPVPRPANVPSAASPETAARGFLAAYGPLFGADDQARQLRLERAADSDRGRSTARFQQLHEGVPVLGGELIVNLDEDRNVLSANGELSPKLKVEVEPSVPAPEAQEEAVTATAKAHSIDRSRLEATAARAVGVRPGPARRPDDATAEPGVADRSHRGGR